MKRRKVGAKDPPTPPVSGRIEVNIEQEVTERRVTRSAGKQGTAELKKPDAIAQKITQNKNKAKAGNIGDESEEEELISVGTPSGSSDSEDSDFELTVLHKRSKAKTKTGKGQLSGVKKHDANAKKPILSQNKTSNGSKNKKSAVVAPKSGRKRKKDPESECTDDDLYDEPKTRTKLPQGRGKNPVLLPKKIQNKSVDSYSHDGNQQKDFNCLEDSSDDVSEDDGNGPGTSKVLFRTSTPLPRDRFELWGSMGKRSESPSSSLRTVTKKAELSVRELLEMNEGRMNDHVGKTGQSQTEGLDDEGASDSDNSEVDWEEVEESNSQNPAKNSSLPSGGLVIDVPMEGFINKKTKKFQLHDLLRKDYNARLREKQLQLHQASLLCLMARGMAINDLLMSEEIQCHMFSLLPKEKTTRFQRVNLPYILSLISWFRQNFKLGDTSSGNDGVTESSLIKQISSKTVINRDFQAFLFVSLLRSLSIDSRLVISLQPLSCKCDPKDLVKSIEAKSEKDSSSQKSSSELKKNQKVSKLKDPNLGRKIISSSDEESEESKKGKRKPSVEKHRKAEAARQDHWVEVYVEETGQWASVDLKTAKIHCDDDLEREATKPILYVLAFDNHGFVKDLTKKYTIRYWMTSTHKMRMHNSSWWTETLEPFQGQETARDRVEENLICAELLKQPVPTSVQECKHHPLFAMKRHLLKFEALYPPEPISVGIIKGEAVYSRTCVKELHTREKWLRQAKVVKLGQKPYKLVKSRPKYDRLLHELRNDNKALELFGEWQTEDYVPPAAKDGKVPRNDYGNVEMFTDAMLPKGCAYIPVPGLGRVAKKLDIDCAPALTGFEYHSRGSHPVFDGFVVCEEFKELLLDAWNQEQDQQKIKDEEKRLKRIYDNWKRLFRGLKIRARLEEKYGVNLSGQASSSSAASAKKKQKKKY